MQTTVLPTNGTRAADYAAERVRRELARRSLDAFTSYLAPWFVSAAHNRLVAEKLEQVFRYIQTGGVEGIGRLMIFKPPRHSKTEQISRLFPSYLLGRMPDKRVILTSYGADLAQDDSRAVRNYVTSTRFKALFGALSTKDTPVELSEDSRAKANWDLASPHRGGVVAAGIGGGITGKGAHLLVVDDPFKSRDEAESEAYRKRVRSWWRSSAYTRLEPGGAVVITHTRWDLNDLAGDLLMDMVNDPLAPQWEVLFMPALALDEDQYPKTEAEFKENLARGIFVPFKDPLGRKPGEALWPERFDKDVLERTQHTMGDFEFSSLYQQLPRPQSGGFLDEADFSRIVEKAPEGMQWFRYVDLALGQSQTSDFNATAAVALDDNGDLYVRDMIRIRELSTFVTILESEMLSPREKGVIWGMEDVAFQALVMRELMRKPHLVNVVIKPVKPDGDKVQRARPLQARAKQKKVVLVRGPWINEFMREVLSFPHGKHDDQVDTVTGGVQMISRMGGKRRSAGQHEGYGS